MMARLRHRHRQPHALPRRLGGLRHAHRSRLVPRPGPPDLRLLQQRHALRRPLPPQVAASSDPLPGLAVEGFGLPDNLMIPGAVLAGGGLPITLPTDGTPRDFNALDVFEHCVAAAAARLGIRL